MRKMKHSGIDWLGEIPENWVVARLKTVSDIITGNTPSTINLEYYNDEIGIEWLKPENILGTNGVNISEQKITKIGEPFARIVPPNTVLTVCIGGSLGKVGYVTQNSAFNQQINGIIFNNLVFWKYGLYYLYSQDEQSRLLALGNIIPILNKERQKQICFPIPPLPEQTAITDFLDNKCNNIDVLIENEEKIISELKEYKKSIIYKAVTKGISNTPHKNNDKLNWTRYRLGAILSLEYGKPLSDEKRVDDGYYPVYGANGLKGKTDDYYFDKKSIVVGRKGSAGELNLTEEKFWPLDVTYFVTFDETKNNLLFLFYLLSILDLPNLAKGIKPGLNRNEVYDIEVHIPSLADQIIIINYLNKKCGQIDNIISLKQQKISELKEYKKSLIYEYVTGKKEVSV